MKIYFSSGSKRKDYGKNPVVVAVLLFACLLLAALFKCLPVVAVVVVGYFVGVGGDAGGTARRLWRLLHLRITRN